MLPGEKKYPHIFTPIQIGKLWAKNRIKYASTETNYNYSDGFVSEKELAYIEAHARGGSGSSPPRALTPTPAAKDRATSG